LTGRSLSTFQQPNNHMNIDDVVTFTYVPCVY